MAGDRTRDYSELLLTLAEIEAAGHWRVMLPASILGFLSAYFRKWAVGQRLRALRFVGAQSSRARTALAAVAIALVAACGLTDAMPPADKRAMLDWVPSITLDSRAPRPDDGPLVTRSYDLTGVLARIDADSASTPDAAADLKWLIELVLQINRPGIDQDGSPPPPSQAAYTLEGAQLEVAAPESLQDKLAENLKAWQQSGLGQICVECRFMTADHDIARALGVSWQLQESRSTDSTPSLNSGQPAAAPVVRAGASVIEYFPVMVATLSKQQATALVQAGYGQPGRNSIQSPKVTAFNGTQVSIGDRTQTPFVVGIQKSGAGAGQPIIRILEEGSTITFRAVHSGDRRQVHLEGRLEFSKIGDVYEAQTSIMFGGEPATVQVPCAKRWRIDFDSTVNEGASVLIGFVPTYEKKLIVYALLTVQTVVPDAAVAAN